MFFLSSADFFQNKLFRKILSWIPPVSNSFLDPDQAQNFLVKGYQQTRLVHVGKVLKQDIPKYCSWYSKPKSKACHAEYFYVLHSSIFMRKLKISKILNFLNSFLKICSMPTIIGQTENKSKKLLWSP